jgi:hypothetical protein
MIEIATRSAPERTHRALVLRWGERASSWHPEHPGRSYVQGEVRMPRRDVWVTANHDGHKRTLLMP